MSRFGIGYDTFLDLVPIELYLALEDDLELRQYQIKTISESIRTSTLHLMNVQLARKDKVRDEKKLWGFSWDGEDEGKESQTKEQMKNIMKSIAGNVSGKGKRRK